MMESNSGYLLKSFLLYQCVYCQITAEYGVKMISVYTKDETQRQSLLHFIQDHIGLHPGQSKTNLNRDSICFCVYYLIRLRALQVFEIEDSTNTKTVLVIFCLKLVGIKGPIFSGKYWYYLHCPKNVLRSILSFVF